MTATRHTRRWRRTLLLATGAALVAWSAASGYYLAFHDTILAGLMTRQAAMQYAYEDKIAELRTVVDEARREGLLAGAPRSDGMRDLEAEAARLSARMDALDALLSAKPRAGTGPTAGAPVPERLKAIAGRQAGLVESVTALTEQRSQRLLGALGELGLTTPDTTADSGGPFVPFDAGELSDGGISALRGALARRRQLQRVADRLPLRQPVAGPLDVTSGYGARRDPFLGRLALHTGTDLRRPYGSIVRAVASGTVTNSGPESGYGVMVAVDHGNGYSTRYAHLSRATARVGDVIAAGAPLGEVGTTGRSTGPHLHYEVRIAGEPVDPERYLSLATAIEAR